MMKRLGSLIVVSWVLTAPAAHAGIGINFSIGSDGAKAAEAAAAAVVPAGQASVDGISQFFRESASARYVMTSTDQGKQLLARVVSKPVDQISAKNYQAFLDRIDWQSNSQVRDQLYQKLRKLDDAFSKQRVKDGMTGKMKIGEAMSPDESAYLSKQAARLIKASDFKGLTDHSTSIVSMPKSGYARTRADASESSESTRGEETSIIDIPIAPVTAEGVLDTASVKTANSWQTRLGIWARAYDNYFKFLRLTDGDWGTLLGMSGNDFSDQDAIMLRKLNRLLGTLNNYSKTRLTIQAFTMERPALYNQLNQATVESTRKFLEGQLSEDAYLQARADAAKNLNLNDIVNKADSAMVESVSQSKILGGTGGGASNGGTDGLIVTKELDIKEQQVALQDASSRLEVAQKQLDEAATDSDKETAQQQLILATSDRDLLLQKIKGSSDQLNDLYMQFVDSYEPLELFANLRNGLLNGDPVPAFDLPDSMVVNQTEVQSWSDIYDRALTNSTDQIVLNETKAYFKARAYDTRKFISDLNDSTGKFFGTKFTDSQFGTEFKAYSKGVFTNMITKMATYVAGPGAGVLLVAHHGVLDNYFGKFWNAIFSSPDKPALKTTDDADASTATPAASPTPDPSPSADASSDTTKSKSKSKSKDRS